MSWPWDYFSGVTDMVQAIITLPWAIADIFVQLLMCVAYPIVILVGIFQDAINALIAEPLTLVNVLIGIPNIVINIVNVLLIGTFPTVWIALLVGSVLLVFGLRLYALLKGVTILGCGI